MPILGYFYMVTFLLLACLQNWFTMWVSMELNTLLFLGVMSKKENVKVESMVTYFLMQSLASMMMMLSVLDEEMKMSAYTMFPCLLFLMSTLLKIGSAPLHLWFISTSFFMKSLIFLFILSVQKLYPLYFILQMKLSMSAMFMGFVALSFMAGSSHNFMQSMLKMVLIFSSVSHMGWLLLSLKTSWFFQTFFIYYTVMLFLFMGWVELQNTSLIMQNKILIMMLVMTLGGLPPLMGFFPKLILFSFCLGASLIFLLMFMVVFSLIDLYIYSRIVLMWLPRLSFKKKWNKKLTSSFKMLVMTNILMLPLL